MGTPPAGVSAEALARLREYTWPGNVRELENIIERAMILARGGELAASHHDFGRRAGGTPTPVPAASPVAVASTGSGATPAIAAAPSAEDGKSLAERLLESERKEIMAAVERSKGNIASASRILGINRSTLYYRLRKHGLEHLLPTKVAVGGGDEPAGEGPAS
jgi:DNA-binding NtrC family response regulator